MAAPKFGPLQLRIMQILWERRAATASAVTKALQRERDVAHSTVQTLLRQLEEKGAVKHERRGREFLWRPRLRERHVTSSATRRFVREVFGGSAYGLVAHLLRNERLSDEEIERIRELLREEES